MRIGIAFDLIPLERGGDGPDDRFEEFDRPETVEAIAEVLRGEGHDVTLLGDGRELLRRVLDDPPDFVWNLAEGQGVGRSREARVPAALEMLGIPYSGSDPLTLAASLDKDVCRRLVRSRGGRIPKGTLVTPRADPGATERALGVEFSDPGDYPVIVKPAFEGSSKGIRGRCLAESAAEAAAAALRLADEYEQPVLVEAFIDGDEVTVGLVGNGERVEVLGAMRIVPKGSAARFVYSLEVKRDWRRRVEYEAPALLPAGVMRRLIGEARLAFDALGCRDLARIDFRLRDGVPYFIEANPLPGLAPVTSDLVILARGHGLGHADLIRKVLHTALDRVGLPPEVRRCRWSRAILEPGEPPGRGPAQCAGPAAFASRCGLRGRRGRGGPRRRGRLAPGGARRPAARRRAADRPPGRVPGPSRGPTWSST